MHSAGYLQNRTHPTVSFFHQDTQEFESSEDANLVEIFTGVDSPSVEQATDATKHIPITLPQQNDWPAMRSSQ